MSIDVVDWSVEELAVDASWADTRVEDEFVDEDKRGCIDMISSFEDRCGADRVYMS